MVSLDRYMNKNQIAENFRKHSSISNFLIRVLFFLIFCLIALIAIIYSLGFNINWQHFRIKETGIIYLDSSIGAIDANVQVNGVFKKKLPASFTKMPEGHYLATITKPDFISWSKNFEVYPSKVSVWEDVVLIKENINVRTASDEEVSQLNRQIDEPLDKTIVINDNELWVNNQLVTRFSDNITNAIWYPDGAHLVYQIKNKIKIIEIDGKNETELARLSTDNPSIFRFLAKGKELLYQNGDRIFVATIY